MDVYQKLQPAMWPVSFHVTSNPYKLYVFQNKYNFLYGTMSLFLRKLC